MALQVLAVAVPGYLQSRRLAARSACRCEESGAIPEECACACFFDIFRDLVVH